MPDIKTIADKANMIINSYAFTHEGNRIYVLNLNSPDKAILPKIVIYIKDSCHPCHSCSKLHSETYTKKPWLEPNHRLARANAPNGSSQAIWGLGTEGKNKSLKYVS